MGQARSYHHEVSVAFWQVLWNSRPGIFLYHSEENLADRHLLPGHHGRDYLPHEHAKRVDVCLRIRLHLLDSLPLRVTQASSTCCQLCQD